MEPRQKVSLALLTDCISFRQTIKATVSEINKDLLQIDESSGKTRKTSFEIECKRLKTIKQPCRKKMKITEDVGPILGLASLMNEIFENPSVSPPKIEEKITKVKQVKNLRGHNKKLSKFSRAATHLAIAYLIKEQKDKKISKECKIE